MIAALLLATTLTPGIVAMSLESPPADRAPILHAALSDDDARVRAAGARIVAVTNARDLTDDVRAALAKETNAEAAREEIRAIGMNSGMKDLDALLASAKKFGLEAAAWTSIARGNGPAAVQEMLTRKLAVYGVFAYGLSGHPDLAPVMTSRILGMGDAKMWAAWLAFLGVAEWPLPPQIAPIAVAHPNAAISEATINHLAQEYASSSPPAGPKPLLEALDRAIAATPQTSTRAAFMREMLGRALGRKKEQRDEWMQWLREHKYAASPVKSLLTREETEANNLHWESPTDTPYTPIAPQGNSAFTVMTDLPKGVADEVIDATKCDGDWVGLATATVDQAGRVVDADPKNLWGSDRCKRALSVLMRASFAAPRKLPVAGMAADILLAHHGAMENCLDEDDVDTTVPGAPLPVGGDVVAPKKVKSVEPLYPETARLARDSGIVIIRAVINRKGCITSMSILKPLTPLLNTSALIAMSQWRFTPGMLDGKPVEVFYNLTINFKLK